MSYAHDMDRARIEWLTANGFVYDDIVNAWVRCNVTAATPPPADPVPPATSNASIQRFASGAVRSGDANGTRYDLISPVALEALAETYADGAAKYGDHNWLNGIPTSDLLNHALRHLVLWQKGDTSEPHLAHAAWNLLAMIHFEKTRPELVVRPYAEASEKGGAP